MRRGIFWPLALTALLAFNACARPLVSLALAAGVAAARADDWDEAVRQWTAACERDPGSAAAHNNLAVAFERRGAWDDARREYETAVRLDPDNPTVKFNLEAFKARLESARGRTR
jgi:Flp pilus assembly protein TadD